MTDFISIFQPGMQYVREQRDLDKILVVESPNGADGPQPIDIESGKVTIELPPREDQDERSTPEAPGGEVTQKP